MPLPKPQPEVDILVSSVLDTPSCKRISFWASNSDAQRFSEFGYIQSNEDGMRNLHHLVLDPRYNLSEVLFYVTSPIQEKRDQTTKVLYLAKEICKLVEDVMGGQVTFEQSVTGKVIFMWCIWSPRKKCHELFSLVLDAEEILENENTPYILVTRLMNKQYK